MSTTFYFVRSRHDRDLFRLVSTRSDGTLRCDCEDYRFNHNSACYHIRETAAGRALAAQPKRAAVPLVVHAELKSRRSRSSAATREWAAGMEV